MTLPLQPELRPDRPHGRRALIAGLLVALILGLGVLVERGHSGPRLLCSGPDDGPRYVDELLRRIAGARQRIWVLLYVLRQDRDADGPVHRIVDGLAAAVARGVDVRVVLDAGQRWDRPEELDTKHVAAAAWLEERGIPVLIDELERTTHAKVVLIDESCALLGSHNWTWSALMANRETSLLIEDPPTIAALAELCRSVPGFADRPRDGRK